MGAWWKSWGLGGICPRAAPFEGKLRPEWSKKQDLAVNLAGTARVREKITARLVEKARIGRKKGGDSLSSRGNYGQIR